MAYMKVGSGCGVSTKRLLDLAVSCQTVSFTHHKVLVDMRHTP